MCAMSAISSSFLYAIAAFDLLRIGISHNPQQRARAIHGRLLHSVEIPRDRTANAERYTHSLLWPYKESSKWFSCDAGTAITAIDAAKAALSAETHLKTLDQPGLAKNRGGLLRHYQRRADLTAKRLKIAIPLWYDPRLTVKEISARSGLSRTTLHANLPPRLFFWKMTDA